MLMLLLLHLVREGGVMFGMYDYFGPIALGTSALIIIWFAWQMRKR
jgi:hypothetical protein